MKKYLVLFFLLASLTSFGQFSNYTNINGRYKWIAGKFDSTFTLPSGTTPSLRTGGGTGPGAMFYRTSDSTIYQYTGTQWVKLRGSLNPTDTAGLWVTNLYKKTGSDSIFYVKGGSHIFAFVDEKGTPGGGGGGKVYYFNGGVNMGTFGGLTMYELGDTANTGTAANFTRATTGSIASFITDPNKPGLLQIPAGSWTIDAWLSETGGGSNHAEIWVEVEKWDGSTITTIATSPIEEITNGSTPDLYTWSVSIPTTVLAITDRIIIQFYITNTNGKTVTLYTQNGYVGEVHTTFTTGIGSLNGLTAPSQFFATGTSGTDFNIASATATHTFNLPTASGTNRGALSSADWTTFNSKVGGSGTTNYLSKWTSSSALGNSLVFDNGTSVGLGTTSPSATYIFDVVGKARIAGVTYPELLLGTTSFLTFSGSGNFISIINGSGATAYGVAFGSNINSFQFYAGSGTERMRLTSSGRLLIGTTTESTYLLDVSGTFRSTGDANINGLTVGLGGGSVATNTAVGFQSIGNASATGTNNVAVGYQAGLRITTGFGNTMVGSTVGTFVTTGHYNTLVGQGTGNGLTTGRHNTYIGWSAGTSASGTTEFNTAVGSQSGNNISSGTYNTFFGYASGLGFTTGTYNTVIGTGTTGNGITTGSFNTIIGSQITGLSSSLSNTIILADGQGNQRLYINNTGLTGLGITSPANALHIDRGTATASYLQFTAGTTTGQTASDGFEVGIDASGNGVINQQENLPMLFYTNNTERMRIGADGNVGIGTTSPDYRLTLSSTSTSFTQRIVNTSSSGRAGIFLQNDATAYSVYGTYGTQFTPSNLRNHTVLISSHDLYLGSNDLSNNNGSILFFTGGNLTGERMRIFGSTGNISVNSTTDAGYKLDVNGTARVQGNMAVAQATLPGTLSAGIGYLFLGGSACIWNPASSTQVLIGMNQYYDGTNSVRKVTGSTSSIYMDTNGDINFSYAGSAAAGTTITATTNLSIKASGNTVIAGNLSNKFGSIPGGVDANVGYFFNGGAGIFWGANNNNDVVIGSNNYWNGSNQLRIKSGYASSAVFSDNGSIALRTATTSTAGSTITFDTRLHINNTGEIGIGTTSPNASALLDVSSTTKGFLPPRMTGANAEAIGTPAAGLLVYINNGNGTTITSTGWWGYDGTTWVKLN